MTCLTDRGGVDSLRLLKPECLSTSAGGDNHQKLPPALQTAPPTVYSPAPYGTSGITYPAWSLGGHHRSVKATVFAKVVGSNSEKLQSHGVGYTPPFPINRH